MGQPRYTGDDGRKYGNPCTSGTGRKKKRWATPDAAWFVVDLAMQGLYHVAKGRKLELYAYECPKCGRWHTASVKNEEQRQRRLDGLAAWREKQRK